MASNEKMFAIHRLSSPACSTRCAVRTTASMLSSPPDAPSITPMRMFPSSNWFERQTYHGEQARGVAEAHATSKPCCFTWYGPSMRWVVL